MNYPKWWNDTITVYNKYLDDDRIAHFKRTVVRNCFYTTRLFTNNDTGSVLIPSSYGVRVRKDDNYVTYLEWNPQLDKYTFNSGDIIIKGEVEDEINDAVKGKTINETLKKYKGSSFTVSNVKENLKIDLQHYLVTGD